MRVTPLARSFLSLSRGQSGLWSDSLRGLKALQRKQMFTRGIVAFPGLDALSGSGYNHSVIDKTLAKIEAAIMQVRTADPKNKAELIRLLEQLKSELPREQRSDDLLRSASEGLKASAVEFEATHPKLAPIINEVCALLASIGV